MTDPEKNRPCDLEHDAISKAINKAVEVWDTSVLTTGEYAKQVDTFKSGHKDYPYALMIGKCLGEENLIKASLRDTRTLKDPEKDPETDPEPEP